MPRLVYVLFAFFLLLLATGELRAQQAGMFSNLRCKTVKASPLPFTPDTLSLVPGSIYISGDTALHASYNINTNKLSLRGRFTQDSVTLCYRVYPLLFSADKYRRNLAQYDSNALFVEPGAALKYQQPGNTREQLINTPGLNKNGTLTRGISIGNTQNVFVNSALNLQLEGRISPDIRLTAVISDQNVPFQPQGNTQNIREFDKVYVQLDHKHASLVAGDVVLQNPANASAFMRYYKNVQGGSVSAFFGDSLHNTTTSIAASAAKGRFNSMAIEPQDGVSGPYRLSAPGNEIFIIVLAGSEKVWLDGRLLRRGFGLDYVIDYNAGEITFTPTVLITRYSRIRVDFEYSDRNYSRSILAANHAGRNNKLSWFLNWYREADDPDRPFSFNPDSAAARRLGSIGDSISKAVISGASPVTEYSADQILYTLHDTLGDSIYIYTPRRAERMYSLIFSDVGQGSGDYELQTTAANGRIYRYVGRSKGRYLPVRQVVTPKLKSMTAIGGTYRLGADQQVYAEYAVNTNNLNRFAPENVTDKTGQAIKMGYRLNGKPIAKTLAPGWKYHISADYELLGSRFDSIDRFRAVDFNRDWSATPGVALRADDHIITLAGALRKNPDNLLSIRNVRRIKGNNVDGWQQQADFAKTLPFLQINGSGFLMNNSRPDYHAFWRRLSAGAYVRMPKIRPGYRYTADQNQLRQIGSDRILRTAMFYTEHKFYLKNLDTTHGSIAADYAYRNDRDTLNGELVPATKAHTATLSASTKSEKKNTAGFSVIWRKLESSLPQTRLPGEESLTGRFDQAGDYLQRHIRSELTYSIGTGRELKREYRYVKIAVLGEGQYQWIDYNEDGIQQLDEFVEAARPEDRQYIRVFVPTATYIKAFSNALSWRLNLNGPRNWADAGGIKKQISRLSSTNAYTTDRKLTAQDIITRFNPLPIGRQAPDSQLISTAQTLRSTLFWNRTDPGYGADIAFTRSRQKALLTQGFDSRDVQELRLNTRITCFTVFSIQPMFLSADRNSASDFLKARNYRIIHRELAPQLVWQPGANFRLTGTYGYADKRNPLGDEKAGLTRFTLETRVNKVSVRSITATMRFTKITFSGESSSSPAAYEMLEALRPGNNLTWTLNLQQKLTPGLQLTLNYEGRKSDGGAPIHLGKVQVTALF
ncbi:MAG: hypothetical protein V4543_00130 [Bacteroidota bacterium]